MKHIFSLIIMSFAVFSLSGQNAVMKTSDYKYGVTNASGNWIIQPVYDYIEDYETLGLYGCTAGNSHKMEIFSYDGKKVAPPVFDILVKHDTEPTQGSINEGYSKGNLRYLVGAVMNDDGKALRSIYDLKTQKLMFPWKYTLLSYYNGLIQAMINPQDEKKDYYNIEGKLVVADVNDAINIDNNAGKYYTYFVRDGLKGVADPREAKVIFTPREVELISVTDDDQRFEVYLELQPKFRRTYYDKKTCKEIVPMKKYESADDLGDGLYRVLRNGKYGLFCNGKEIVECTFDRISDFNGGVAQFEKNGEVRLIKNPMLGDSGPEIKQLIADAANKRSVSGAAVSRYPVAESDVDLDIPTSKTKNENLFALIIANENYPDAPVPYALNDGRAFYKYCENMLGIPSKNITMLEDASYGAIIGAVEKLKKVADAYDGKASVVVYYAGHGFPDEKQQSAYLLPIDGNASDIATTGFSLADFYRVLGSINLKSSIVFLDACFSGTKREDEMLAQARGVAIKVKEDRPGGNMVVFSASQGDETAHQMEENRHGLFTYFLLKGLKEQGPETTIGDLSDYVTRQVRRQSVVINDKRQTPTVIPSASATDTWRDIRIAQ